MCHDVQCFLAKALRLCYRFPLSIFSSLKCQRRNSPDWFFQRPPLVLGVEISEAVDLQVDPGHCAREPEAIPGCAENLQKHKHPSKAKKRVSLPGKGSFCSISLTVFFFLSVGYRVSGNRWKGAQAACYSGWPFNPSTQTLSTTMAEPIRTGQSSPPLLVGLSFVEWPRAVLNQLGVLLVQSVNLLATSPAILACRMIPLWPAGQPYTSGISFSGLVYFGARKWLPTSMVNGPLSIFICINL